MDEIWNISYFRQYKPAVQISLNYKIWARQRFVDFGWIDTLHVDAYRLFGLGFILKQTDAEGIAGEWSKQASGIYPKLNREIRRNEQNWCQKGCFLRVWEHMFAWDAEKEI